LLLFRKRWPALALVICLIAAWKLDDIAQAVSNLHTPQVPVQNVERVMVIGSSIAKGWNDPSGGGFLPRAFASFSEGKSTRYEVDMRAVAGETVTKVGPSYVKWLKTDRPQIVALAWGALDDLHNKTPIKIFKEQIAWEIREALAAHAVVFVITPPITPASFTQYKTEEPRLVNEEIAAAKSIHSPNVYVFDVFNEMISYLKEHGESYIPYMNDGWHPNTAGHKLAGELLYQDLNRTFGNRDVVYKK
jgi:acyl-CoA thioesterase I